MTQYYLNFFDLKKPTLLLITPPLTQLNTPYPATAYLKGYLKNQGYEVAQADLGLEMVLQLFSKPGLQSLFKEVREQFAVEHLSPNAQRILFLEKYYVQTIDPVIRFLQNKDTTLAHRICYEDMLPRASRFEQLVDQEWAFGSMGINDQARYLCTLYIEDLGDLIKETVAPEFGFTRYAESLAMSATYFDEIHARLQQENNLPERLLCGLLEEHLQAVKPDVVGFSVPFPGNLFGALKCAQYIKTHHPHIKTTMGGGYANTELRDLKAAEVFDYFDFVTLDDGEGPVQKLLEYLTGERPLSQLQRTFHREQGEVRFINSALDKYVPHTETGTPDYSGLPLDKYLSVIDVANPMHRLWSDGRWNKLTMAHGCYWKKCTFCDISLDYIGRYDAAPAQLLVDRIEEIVAQTGQTGFHFVDEAAPPLVMRDMALELIRRGVTITWWANIRFEKTFTPDLCRLLAASGCIAVSGGLEVASDRLLALMKKGVTIEQVARVTKGFTDAGIMVHTYLMYGFPTQSEQETIDSLEVVRQLFLHGVMHSAYWHRFSMTAHSPVGLNPEAFEVVKIGPEQGTFAYNDLQHEDPTGADHGLFTSGLNKALYNYMHGIGLDFPLQEWFDFPVKKVTVPKNLIERALSQPEAENKQWLKQRILWLGNAPVVEFYERQKKGRVQEKASLIFFEKSEEFDLHTDAQTGEWLAQIFPQFLAESDQPLTLEILAESYDKYFPQGDFERFLASPLWVELRERGLLLIKN
jgi:hypothetical protein